MSFINRRLSDVARTADPTLKQKILLAAREVFKEKGFAAARMSDIAERAGVAVGSIYLHFKTKEALCSALSDEVNRRIVEESLPLLLQPDPAKAIADGIRDAMRIMDEERDLLSLLYLNIGLGPFEDYEPTETDLQVWHTLAHNLQARMDAGEFKRYDPNKLAQLISNLIERTAVGCLIMGAGEIKDYEDITVTFLQNAVLTNPPTPTSARRDKKRSSKRRIGS
jgi:AcrR family transcriptional regulator